jgi:hypothetical protein
MFVERLVDVRAERSEQQKVLRFAAILHASRI